MSKALKMARDMHEKGCKPPNDGELTTQEYSLFLNASLFLKSQSNHLSWSQIVEIARKLDEGGVLDPPSVVRWSYLSARKSTLEMFRQAEQEGKCMIQTPGYDDISASNICHSSLSDLKECFISDLMTDFKGVPASGCYIRVKVIEPTFKTSSILCCVEDDESAVVTLAIYNMIPFYAKDVDAEDHIPVGCTLIIKSPYLKLSNSGSIALRVDNPCNIEIVHPTLSTREVTIITPTADEFKKKGNDFFGVGDHVSAIECYSKGLECSEKLKKDLYSNRAACRLHTFDFDGVIVDCEVVLALDPSHAKAMARLKLAHEGLAKMSQCGSGCPDPPVQGTSVESVSNTTSADALKNAGNMSFKAQDYATAIDCYTRGIVTLEQMRIVLQANRAASRLALGDFTGTIADCETVLAIEPTHTKALLRKEKAITCEEEALKQKEGIYNFLTLPFNPNLQDRVANYYGPIEIRSSAGKGRGLFTTRDVHVGELLLVEKAIAFKISKDDEAVNAVNFSSKKMLKGSTAQLLCELTVRANNDPFVNSQLAFLVHDYSVFNPTIPSMELFREGRYEAVPTLSSKQINGVVDLNVFSFSIIGEPTRAERLAIQNSQGDAGKSAFLSGYAERQEKLKKLHSRKVVEGTALWIVGSFMNHDECSNSTKEFFGKLMIVRALQPLKAGEEISTYYHSDRSVLKSFWGIG